MIVAPTGNTKLATSSSTPKCSVTRSIVTGNVAALELVENANNCAGEIPLRNDAGLLFVKMITMRIYTPIIDNKPSTTVNAYQPRALKRSALGDSTTRAARSANTP